MKRTLRLASLVVAAALLALLILALPAFAVDTYEPDDTRRPRRRSPSTVLRRTTS